MYIAILSFIAILIGGFLQKLFNETANKRGYGLGKNAEKLAIVLSAFFWGYLVYDHEAFHLNTIIVGLAATVMISTLFVDYKHYIIPDGYSLLMLILGVAYVLTHLEQWMNLMLGGIVAFGVFLLLMILSGENVGGGDVKLVAGIGLFIGLKSLLMYLALSFLIGAVFAAILIFAKVKSRKDKIPFGPCLALGFLFVLL